MSKRYVLLDKLVGEGAGELSGAAADRGGQIRAGQLVVVPGPSLGGPDRLSGAIADVLIGCERGDAPTVLLAADVADLETGVAAVCRYVVADRPDVVEEARARFGEDRVHAVESVDADRVREWIGDLPVASHGLAGLPSRIGALAGRIPSLGAVYEKVRGR